MSSGPESDSKVIALLYASCAIAVTAVVLRFFCRKLRHAQLKVDDYLILISLIFNVGIAIASVYLIRDIRRRHNQRNGSHYLKVLYANTFLYAPTIAFAKLSVVCLYRRVLPVRAILRWTIILGVIIAIWCFGVIIADTLTCIPVRKAWDPTVSGRCIDMQAYSYGLQIPNIVTGFALLILPLPTVWGKSGLSRSEKLKVSGVVLVGVIPVAFAIARLLAMVRLRSTADMTNNQVSVAVWTELEIGVTIMAACLPILRPLLRCSGISAHKRQKSSKHGSSDSNDYGDSLVNRQQPLPEGAISFTGSGERIQSVVTKNENPLPIRIKIEDYDEAQKFKPAQPDCVGYAL